MKDSSVTTAQSTWLPPVARIGLIAKGFVYCLIGLLAFMAAFELGGQNNNSTTKQGVFSFIEDQPGGNIIEIAVAIGLLCYSVWRIMQTFLPKKNENKGSKIGNRIRYFFSGLVYLSLSIYAWGRVLKKGGEEGSSSQHWVSLLLDKPYGQWGLGLVALGMAGIGIYQIYYGLSQKYKKHITGMQDDSNTSAILEKAGAIGYTARGLVWLMIAWLFLKAALNANSSEAGDTGKAFQFLENTSYGSFLMGAVGFGLICYGVFNFIRARFETFR